MKPPSPELMSLTRSVRKASRQAIFEELSLHESILLEFPADQSEAADGLQHVKAAKAALAAGDLDEADAHVARAEASVLWAMREIEARKAVGDRAAGGYAKAQDPDRQGELKKLHDDIWDLHQQGKKPKQIAQAKGRSTSQVNKILAKLKKIRV